MPRQLDRIQKANEYYHHPLRKEYEAKKTSITRMNKGFLYYLGWSVQIGSWIMTIGYLVIWIFVSDVGINEGFIVMLLGLLNLAIAFFGPIFMLPEITKIQEERNRDSLNKLKEEYKKKNLYEFTEADLVSRCLDEGYNGEPICGVTGAYIGYDQKYYFCKQPGNCLKCKTFMKAYLGEDWHGEYEME